MKTANGSTEKGGRPEWQPTAKHRDQAALLKACGESEENIARVFGISLMTLRKHLGPELVTARVRKRAEILEMLQKSAKAGNVSAQKHLEAMTSLTATSREEVAITPAPKPLGKKEEQAIAAAHPNRDTPMGELMAERQRQPVNWRQA